MPSWFSTGQRQVSTQVASELEEAAERNRLISEEAPRVFEKLLECFKSSAAKTKAPGVALAFERPERDLACLIVMVHGGTVPLRTVVSIQLDLELQEIRCSSSVGGTDIFHFSVAGRIVGLSQEGRPIRKLDSVCEIVLRPLLSAVRALR